MLTPSNLFPNLLDYVIEKVASWASAFSRKINSLEGYEEPIYVSVGIDYGKIEGFFTKTRKKYYDVFGSAMNLSDRYQSYRKVVLDKPESNMIFISERVYKRLSDSWKNRFEAIEVVEGKKVRDDPKAKFVYLYKMPVLPSIG